MTEADQSDQRKILGSEQCRKEPYSDHSELKSGHEPGGKYGIEYPGPLSPEQETDAVQNQAQSKHKDYDQNIPGLEGGL
jgi:hypothetical protein